MAGMRFSQLMRFKRALEGWTLTKLAEESGVSQSYLSQLENEQKGRPSPKVLSRLVKTLKIKDEELAQVDWDVPQEYAQLLKAAVGRARDPLARLPKLLERAEELVNGEGVPDGKELGQLVVQLRRAQEELLPLLADVNSKLAGTKVSCLAALLREAEALDDVWVEALTKHAHELGQAIARAKTGKRP